MPREHSTRALRKSITFSYWRELSIVGPSAMAMVEPASLVGASCSAPLGMPAGVQLAVGVRFFAGELRQSLEDLMSILSDLKNRAMYASRQRKVDHFYRLCTDEARVLDVGVSRDLGQGGPHLNFFLKSYRLSPETYTGLGIQDIESMADLYPGKRFVQYAGGRFPFPDRSFTHCFSNAVIEHVGNEEDQVGFVNEMLRVAGHVFFTTPNKFFPVESHTNALFVHWHDEYFWRWCELHRPYWTRQNLNLFSRQRLDRVMRRTCARRYEIIDNKMLGLTMTFTVTCAA